MSNVGERSSEVQALARVLQTATIPKAVLQAICSVNGISKAGTKADIQKRIIQQLNAAYAANDWTRVQEIRESIVTRTPVYVNQSILAQATSSPIPPPQPPQPAAYQPNPSSSRRPQPAPQPWNRPAGNEATLPGYAMAYQGYQALSGSRPQNATSATGYQTRPLGPGLNPPAIQYKPSPFYEPKYQVADVKTLEGVMTAHRNTERISVKVQDHPALQLCVTDRTMRVFVMCTADKVGPQDIAFPYQCELKVNGGDIKANLRGLKNKPGSTRPVDITDALRLKPAAYPNNVELTYALTQKRFYFSLVVCKTVSIETLVAQIQKKIRKESVIAEITNKASDPDVVATSVNLSLKCPLTYMRLKLPCRGVSCNHIQCFDATSYLQLQEQGPQWICPICSKPAPFDQLAIDEYAREILSSTPESVEQVTIEPDGKWSVPGDKRQSTASQEASLLDDDVIEVTGTYSKGLVAPAAGRTSTATPHLGTPTSIASRDTPAATRSGNKRPAPEVIDLTLDDSDDEPPRPVKRVNYGTGAGSGGGLL